MTKTPTGWGAEFSFPESGTVNSQRFENRRRSGSLFSGPVVAGRAVFGVVMLPTAEEFEHGVRESSEFLYSYDFAFQPARPKQPNP